jgi:hypothetical protein
MRHGTRSTYNKGCRCEECTDAARVYRNEQRLRTGKVKNSRINLELKIYKCAFCDKEVRRKKIRGRVYCNTQCSSAHKAKERAAVIIERDSGEGASSRVVRNIIINRDGYKCRICGISEWNNEKAPLVMDHIDGNPENWKLSNLRMICCNCDAFTPFYKGRNKGNGRFKRRQRFLAGLSY